MERKKQLNHLKITLFIGLLLWVVFFLVSTSIAAHERQHGLLSLQQAWRRVLIYNHGLKSVAFGVNAAEGAITQAALIPNPSINVWVENVGGSGPYDELNEAESTFLLSQPFELGRKRFHRVQVAQTKNSYKKSLVQASQSQAFEKTAWLFLTIAELTSKLKLASEAIKLNQKTVEIIKKHVAAGRRSTLELKSAQIALFNNKLLQQTLHRQWLAYRYALASLWNGHIRDVRRVTLKNFNIFRLVPLYQLMKKLTNNYQLKVLQTQEQVAHRKISLAKANGYPNVTIGAGVRHFNDTHDTAYVFELSVPVPLFNRNQGNTAKAIAESEQSVENELSQQQKIRESLFKTYQTARQLKSKITLLQHTIIPKARQALKLARAGYNRGRYTYLDLLNAQKNLVSEKMRYLTALYQYRKAWLKLQILTGALPKQGLHS